MRCPAIPQYAQRAARISALARDLSEFLPELTPILKGRLRTRDAGARSCFTHPARCSTVKDCAAAWKCICAAGIQPRRCVRGSHLCCGSAGAYSVLQPELAMQLRDRKLGNLLAVEPQFILSANIGCLSHLQAGTKIPVKHWIEALDEVLDQELTLNTQSGS